MTFKYNECIPAASIERSVEGSKSSPVSSLTSLMAASVTSSPGSILPAGKYH